MQIRLLTSSFYTLDFRQQYSSSVVNRTQTSYTLMIITVVGE